LGPRPLVGNDFKCSGQDLTLEGLCHGRSIRTMGKGSNSLHRPTGEVTWCWRGLVRRLHWAALLVATAPSSDSRLAVGNDMRPERLTSPGWAGKQRDEVQYLLALLQPVGVEAGEDQVEALPASQYATLV
jgi:hypothetical protein